ncbi:hypothetical protein AFK62_08095 [Cronobacter condimenti 1330]|uniref:Uncharacterized protein n=2 Tax=Cronobacter condimenti TaxID=1163710 RepID=A0ABM5VHS2_9ENTR|nr:hypothetical protein [Cronobacter condimenti]ALB64730.1 hypothetical protein AFK62_08095 [Cronobacter condimenti 1330]
MQQVNSVSLIKVQQETDLSQARSEVIFNGKMTGIVIPGHVLEAAVQVNKERYVLFLTDDVIFEESLTLALIDLDEGIKEIVRVGNDYSTGTFEMLSVTAEGITFRFMGDFRWTVTVSDVPRLRLPFVSDPKGVKRGAVFKRYLALSAHTASENAR